jgi:uncharacterized membrane protein
MAAMPQWYPVHARLARFRGRGVKRCRPARLRRLDVSSNLCSAAHNKGEAAMATDPYAAPKAHVEDVPAAIEEGELIADGRAVPAGNGWQWITSGWALFKQQPGMWIGITIAWFVIMVLVAIVPIIGSIANNILFPAFLGGVLLGCRELDRGGDFEFGCLFAGFREHFGKLALVGVYYLIALVLVAIIAALIGGIGVGTAVGLFTGTGDPAQTTVGAMAIMLVALIVLALMVPILMSVWFAPALIVFHNYEVVDALKASFTGCLKNIVPFLLYSVILFALMIAASLPLLLGWLLLGPTVIASVYASYRDIYHAS